MAFPAKNDAPPPGPPPLKIHERHWTCGDEELNGGVNQCDAVLKTRFVGVRTDPKNPAKFVPICEKCAKLVAAGPARPTHYRFVAAASIALTSVFWIWALWWRVKG